MERRRVIFGIIAGLVFLTPAIASAAAVSLPATGQILCYDTAGAVIDCAGTGQDGDLRKGVVWPVPRFVVGTGSESDCVTDTLTGLMWMKNPGATALTWLDALTQANTLDLCGHTDWRLPNVNELDTLLNASQSNMSTWLNTQGFSSSAVSYWTSTSSALNKMNAWRVGMSAGPVNDDRLKSNNTQQFLWAVRGTASGSARPWKTGQALCYDAAGATVDCAGTGQDGDLQQGVSWPVSRFTVFGDCVKDNLTDLVWVKDPDLAARSWATALSDANGLTLCGHSDWRLPNRTELRSLINYGESANADWLVAQGFGNNVKLLEPFWYWTSTTYAASTGFAWVITLTDPRVLSNAKNDSANIRLWPVSDAVFFQPAAAINPASGISADGATLNAAVNPNGLPTTYFFQWGLNTSYPNSAPVPAASAGDGTSNVPVSTPLTGLSPSTTYHYRLAATNAAGTTYSNDSQFTTSGGAPPVAINSVPTMTGWGMMILAALSSLGALYVLRRRHS